MTADILGSAEYFNDQGMTNLGFVKGLYPGSAWPARLVPAEWNAWVTVLSTGTTRTQVAFDFLTSQEYRTDLVAGGPWTPYLPITNWGGYYPEFLLRPGSSAEWSGWVQALASGMSDQAVLAAIFGSPEGYGKWS